jgi:transcriptional regulator with XRE-family HTH domain
MSERPSDRFGERLAYYRKLAGLSAESLSRKVPGMSRAVIANIESGRKREITVDELIALAWALDVPPVVLAVPMERPDAFVLTGGGKHEAETFTRASALVEWFRTGKRARAGKSPAHAIATLRLAKMDDFLATRGRAVQAGARAKRGDESADWGGILEEESKRLATLADELEGLGVDLAAFRAGASGLFTVSSLADDSDSDIPYL